MDCIEHEGTKYGRMIIWQIYTSIAYKSSILFWTSLVVTGGARCSKAALVIPRDPVLVC